MSECDWHHPCGGWGGNLQCLSKLKLHLAFDPTILLPGIFPPDTLPQVPNDVQTKRFVYSSVYNNKGLETAQLSQHGSGGLSLGAAASINWVLGAYQAQSYLDMESS